MYDPSRKEQLFVAIYRLAPNPPPPTLKADALNAQHRAWLQALDDKKLMVGSGPARDENNKNHAGGILIFRCDSLAAAKKLALEEPKTRHGQRVPEVFPWHRMWFDH